MGQFSYKAVNRGGLHTSGVIEAPDQRSAVASLTEQGQFVIEMAEDGKSEVVSGSGGVTINSI